MHPEKPIATTSKKIEFAPILIVASVAILVGGTGLYLSITNRAQATVPSAARKTADFLNSMGVIVHADESPYNKPGANIVDRVAQLGFKHVRTNADETSSTAALLNDLYAKGITTNVTVAAPDEPYLKNIDTPVNAEINFLKNYNLAGHQVDLIENFNEFDSKLKDPDNFDAVLKASTPSLWNSSSELRANNNLKVLAPSLIGNKLDKDAVRLGKVISNTQFDYGNLHSYNVGVAPESSFKDATPTTSQFAIDPQGKPANDLDTKIKYYAYFISKNKPMIITETGYPTGFSMASTYRMTSIYMPRLFVENFRIGVARTYAYQLFDQGPGNGYGFYRDDTNKFEQKPSGAAMHNLTTLLSGGNTDFTTKAIALGYSDDTSDLKKVVMQKSPNEYWVVLWRAKSIFDTETKKDITVNPTSLKITLPSVMNATFYSDIKNPVPTTTVLGSKKSVSVSLGAEVSLLKLTR